MVVLPAHEREPEAEVEANDRLEHRAHVELAAEVLRIEAHAELQAQAVGESAPDVVAIAINLVEDRHTLAIAISGKGSQRSQTSSAGEYVEHDRRFDQQILLEGQAVQIDTRV